MIEIINKLDNLIRYLDHHNCSPDYEVYDGLTFAILVEIELALIKYAGFDKSEYYTGINFNEFLV